MKKNSVIEYCLCQIAKAITFFIRFIPIGFSIFIGRAVGFFAYYVFVKKRRIAYKNLKIAFPGYSCIQINKIVRQTFINSMQHIIEIFYLPWMDKKYIKNHIEFEGLDKVLEIGENKKGIIFLCLHEGSWEVGSLVTSQSLEKFNYAVLIRTRSDIPALSGLLNEYRAKRIRKVITLTDSFRPLIEHLKNGLALGMAADHGAHGGILVDFFSKPALTPTGAMKLALRLDTNLIVSFMKRKGLTRHKISFQVHDLIRTGNEAQEIKSNLESINRKFEEYIRRDPAEYLWFFKRWKYSPRRDVLVLSDGKAGHLKQSLAVVDLMQKLPFQIKPKVIEIKFKSAGQRTIFQVCSFFFTNKCQGCMRCLFILFGFQEAGKLLANSYDAVVSCGSGLAMVNRLVASENMAKSIVVMKPGMFSLKRFDLAIIPEHDNVPKFRNVVLIKGALSRQIDKDNEHIKSIIDNYGLEDPYLSHPIIGVLLGGESKHLHLGADIVEKLINSLDEVVEKLNGSILVSTSRRTRASVDRLLKVKLPKRQGYRMSVIANETNPQGSFEAILHLSDILVVTADSISMISEAINSGKHTIVLKLKRKNPNFVSRHERFTENLAKEGYIHLCDDKIFDRISEIWRQKPSIKATTESERIINRLKEIL
ncbi:ELM1/GtrOC1 family putative glycosyltransferase [Candidatus Omnitrophota bacterium]